MHCVSRPFGDPAAQQVIHALEAGASLQKLHRYIGRFVESGIDPQAATAALHAFAGAPFTRTMLQFPDEAAGRQRAERCLQLACSHPARLRAVAEGVAIALRQQVVELHDAAFATTLAVVAKHPPLALLLARKFSAEDTSEFFTPFHHQALATLQAQAPVARTWTIAGQGTARGYASYWDFAPAKREVAEGIVDTVRIVPPERAPQPAVPPVVAKGNASARPEGATLH